MPCNSLWNNESERAPGTFCDVLEYSTVKTNHSWIMFYDVDYEFTGFTLEAHVML